MNNDAIGDNSKGCRGKAKDQSGKVTNDRFDLIAAKRNQLEDEIQQAYRVVKAAAEKQGDELEEINICSG